MKVLKFGGTSVGTPERMHELVKLIASDEKKIVVLSAVAGTTNILVEIASSFTKGEKDLAVKIINQLYSNYHDFILKLYSNQQVLKEAQEFISVHFDYLKTFSQDIFTLREEKIILAQGEILSTTLFHLYLKERNIESILLSALDFMRIDEEGEPNLDYIKENLKKQLDQYPDKKLFITQGYICRNSFGEIDNLKRGGGDYSASLVGSALRCDEIQIWTDIDGMHNNDPRYVKNTFPIAELSFDEAAELAYFGAKILHPSSVLPAQKYRIPVRLLNTMHPEAKGTLISDKLISGNIKAVAAKDGIVVINIKSSRMLMAYGFLRVIFEIFERFKTSIDMITTSEVAVSLTIDNLTHLDDIIKELQEYGTVSVEMNQAIICVVGDFLTDKPGYALTVFESLKNIPIRMISYGGSKNNVSLLINSTFKREALNALNEGLFNLK